ncbi:MAG: S-layer protein, partial [Planctomycetales bacterium 12-60-4]
GAFTPAVFADIAVLPSSLALTGPEVRQRVLVQRVDNGRIGPQIVEGIVYQSADDKVVRIDNGLVIPVGNGTTEITVTVGTEKRTVPVTVAQFDWPHVWNFRNQVQSVLSKTGCNMGACHGAAAGKNGFKLSLRGYDPEADYNTLTRQARGRRIVPHDPGRSLVLTKPTGMIPHKGGLRFSEDSLEYRVIAEWIAQGQPGPSASDPRIERLEILPAATQLAAGAKQQMIVLAHFHDGHLEDVTRWAKYSSTNHTVAQVDEQGRVTVTGSGEGSIVAWYLAQNVTATVTSPYPYQIPEETFTSAPRQNLIDDLVIARPDGTLQALNVPPSPRCSDSEFLRRAHLDTIGKLPSVEEVQAFLDDADPLKRQRLVESLLTRSEYVDYWTYQWSDLLLLTGNRLRPKALDTYYNWIRERVEKNVPWDEFARGIVLSQGSTVENGAANFYALHQDAQDMSETVSMAFLGMSINCARCHDHPLEKWTNDDYYGMASLFARVRGKGWGGDFRGGDGNRTVFLAERGEVIQPRTGKPQAPKPLDAPAISLDVEGDRREVLADWLTSPANPYFSRAIVNRVWANFMGVGIVEKVDDLRLTNPPSNAELMSALAAELVRHDYDLKSLMRLILNSEAYQRSSEALPENASDERFYAHFYPRRLKAEVLLDAVADVTGVPTEFKDYPAGTRTLQLRDTSVASYFLDTFGRPERILTCTCERSDEPSMTQVLHLANGKTLLSKLEANEGRIPQWIAEEAPAQKVINELYLCSLSRLPTENEQASLVEALSTALAEERRAVLEDLMWSVLTS